MRPNDGRAILDDAIQVWRKEKPEPNENAQKVLARLARDERAAKAFAIMRPQPNPAFFIIDVCVQAELNARTFQIRIANMNRRLKELQKAEEGLAVCRELITEIGNPSDALSAHIRFEEQHVARLKLGLNEWRSAIDDCRRIALETAPRVGATRNRHGKDAGRRAAIGWLADGVRRQCKRPHYRAVALLAEVSLNLPKDRISEDQVRAAYAALTRRDWRQPLSSPRQVRIVVYPARTTRD